MAPPPNKRARILEGARNGGLRVSCRAVARIAAGLQDEDESKWLNTCSSAVSENVRKVSNNYGHVLQDVTLPTVDGKSIQWTILHPFALLNHLCSFDSFGRFAASHLRDKVGRLILWGDEIVTGNQLRPDAVGKFAAIYWTLGDFPEYFRSSDEGWFPVGVLEYEVLKNVSGGYAGVLKKLLHLIFTDIPSFKTGVRYSDGFRNGGTFICRCSLLCFIQDEKAHEEASLCDSQESGREGGNGGGR